MIRIERATRKYGDFTAVDGVSVEIDRGEVVGLLGHNGAGKTTLMKMLTGVLEPTAGTLSVAGNDLVDQRTEAQRHIGYLPESAPLYPEMEVFEYLLLMAELRGVERSEQDAAVVRAMEATGLLDRAGQPIRELSKGYRQRVGIAQAIVHDPDVLVLDEPTNGLDPVQIESIRELITKLAERTTIILSTHILQEVEAVCDRALIMIGGRLVADDKLSTLLATDRVILSVQSPPDDIEAALRQVGAESVEDLGPDPRSNGSRRFALSAPKGGLVPRLLDFARERGWTLSAIGPENRTLETVFKELQHRHARQGVA
ncbi:MAG: ABC transporter ATP-binding protein [Alphaproteobacteria bacterium]|nr:ABC transporter ATP-binding protein [Alphaproteobacteria bacterium]